jgi:hypothetical protein
VDDETKETLESIEDYLGELVGTLKKFNPTINVAAAKMPAQGAITVPAPVVNLNPTIHASPVTVEQPFLDLEVTVTERDSNGWLKKFRIRKA